ncbi:MAG TPA: 50S ribosomal protein L23 [Deltaproteobacteria bacterium]|nr:50S ribosomal protein L23 [Deltaproteobacteria bacterium]HCP45016.1 50S ribosomal protein L23 [Deltaproteobacteria bacterium]|tara:strand:+ start:452 stop:742 length:291 start_codon:yes stop_codon:yes gene_type:complete
MRRIDDVILRPLLTEKATALADAENTFVFEVGSLATKIEIKEAVQQLFSVRVTDVRTMVVRGKNKRFGRHFGKRSNWKKALVTVAEGDTLDFYSGV